MADIFPSVLKIAKLVPVFKKDSKLDYSNYRPITLLTNIEKILEKLICKLINKISLNVKKTEMVIFKSKQKQLEGYLKIKLCSKRLYPTESVKYLGVKIDTNLTWQHHVNDLSIKLNRANAVLFKIRKYVSPKILRSIYFAIFDSHLSYCCLVWAQNFSSIKRILILQKKAVRIINFQPRNSHTSPLFKQNFILKFQDKICLENILFVSKSLNNLSPSIFNT